MSKLKIAWLFPDTLYLHGERGNILALERFAKLAGFEPEVTKIDFKSTFKPLEYDLIFCPPGEISSFKPIVDKLLLVKDELKAFMESGKVLLVTGTSMAIWGGEILRNDGTRLEGLGLVKFNTVEKDMVYGDDIYFTCQYNGKEMEMLCSQIQMADFISDGAASFGKIIYGYGNTGVDKAEGFMVNNSIFTNCLGPMLVTNPWLTKEIMKVLGGRDVKLDFHLERQSFETKKDLTLSKETNLNN
ncbi:MAG: cobalamin biosynthesis protein CobQ [Clostridia bacterium]|nr:cobalamin biosynthesis protein CobQ [Clostridia bacterium]